MEEVFVEKFIERKGFIDSNWNQEERHVQDGEKIRIYAPTCRIHQPRTRSPTQSISRESILIRQNFPSIIKLIGIKKELIGFIMEESQFKSNIY